MARIYYVGALLSPHSSAQLGSPGKQLHATIAYSREWFPYRPALHLFPMIIVPPFTMDAFDSHYGAGDAAVARVPVIRFTDHGLTRRHEELLAAGATRDYPDYKSHISVPAPVKQEALDGIRFMVLEQEYYRTWDDGR